MIFHTLTEKDVIFSCLPGEGRDPSQPWAPAFAGVTGLWCEPWSALAERIFRVHLNTRSSIRLWEEMVE